MVAAKIRHLSGRALSGRGLLDDAPGRAPWTA